MGKKDKKKGGARAKVQEVVKKNEDLQEVDIDVATTVDSEGKVVSKKKSWRESFMWVEMWIDFLASLFVKDRGTIPVNIDDKLYIGNNVYITKNYMSTIIRVEEFGTKTLETFIGTITDTVRDRGCNCVVDYTLKQQKYDVELENSGLNGRIMLWERAIDDMEQSRNIRERAARCLYTVQVAREGKRLWRTRMYITVRAKDLANLNLGEKIVCECLANSGAKYKASFADVQNTLDFMSLVGSKNPNLKDVPAIITSNQVLSQIIPNCGSYNDRSGYFVGINLLNSSPYYIDFSTITSARNMYIVAPSGVGKTVLAISLAQSAYENGSALCFMDIKGNEYNSLIAATNGVIVSLRPTSVEYINSWVMHPEDVQGFDTIEIENYFKSRINFCKQQFIILSGIKEREDILEFEELLEEFHSSLYITYGVDATNVNSWKNSNELNPYVVFEHFLKYLTPQKLQQYNLRKSTIGTLRMYFAKDGNKSYIFTKEFNYADILSADTVSFDFGLLSGDTNGDVNEDLFRLKFLYMSKINSDFVKVQYSKGRRTFKILEESQIVSDDVMKMYVEEYTLRRSQNQDTVLIGNSVQALMNNKLSQPLIENTRGIFVGELTNDALKVVMKQFDIEHLEEYLKIPGSSRNFKNSFFFINNMQSKSNFPIISIVLPKDRIAKNKFKVFCPVKEKSTMGGKN